MSPPFDEKLAFPEWQAPLQELILEFDCGRLRDRVHEVEELLAQRLRGLLREHGAHSERQAIENALAIVRLIKRDRLGAE